MPLILLAVLLAQTPEKPKLVVLEFTHAGGADPSVASVLSENVAAEVAARGFFSPISAREIQTMLGVERQKQLMGCTEDSCFTELAGSMGARFVLSGSLTQLGSLLQLNLQTIDSQKAQVVGRSTRMAKDASELALLLPAAVAEATATPPPPEKSRAVPITLVSLGGLAVVTSGVLAINAFSREQVMQSELTSTDTQLRSLATYRQELANLRVLEYVSLGAGIAGLGLAIAGVVLFAQPGTPAPTKRVQVTVVPTGTGASLVGVFP